MPNKIYYSAQSIRQMITEISTYTGRTIRKTPKNTRTIKNWQSKETMQNFVCFWVVMIVMVHIHTEMHP
jgi:hypothetical protein